MQVPPFSQLVEEKQTWLGVAGHIGLFLGGVCVKAVLNEGTMWFMHPEVWAYVPDV